MKLTGSKPLANVLEHYSLKKSCSAGGQDQSPPDPILDITRQALHQSCFVLALGQSLASPVLHRHTAFQLIQSATWEMNHSAIPETRRWLSLIPSKFASLNSHDSQAVGSRAKGGAITYKLIHSFHRPHNLICSTVPHWRVCSHLTPVQTTDTTRHCSAGLIIACQTQDWVVGWKHRMSDTSTTCQGDTYLA